MEFCSFADYHQVSVKLDSYCHFVFGSGEEGLFGLKDFEQTVFMANHIIIPDRPFILEAENIFQAGIPHGDMGVRVFRRERENSLSILSR